MAHLVGTIRDTTIPGAIEAVREAHDQLVSSAQKTIHELHSVDANWELALSG